MHRPVTGQVLKKIYRQLLDKYGAQHWWPAEAPFEMIVGAILTQSASWINVEKAIANLKDAGALSPQALRQLSLPEIAALIYPSGYYNAKAVKLKAFVQWLEEHYNDNLNLLFKTGAKCLRQKLLSIHGIGEETADSIMLYAAGKPIFVVDAYTRRIVNRIGIAPQNDSYHAYQMLFMENLPLDTTLFNEYHALLVQLAKDTCRKSPFCHKCCLSNLCRFFYDRVDSPQS